VELPPRRRLAGWLLAVLAPVAITVALTPFRSSLGLAGALLCVLLAVLASALAGGIRPAAAATVIGFLAADFFFTVPYYSLRIDRAIDVVGLIVFASVAAATGLLVDVLARRGIQSAHSQAEADGLARLAAGALALGPGTRPEMASALRRTFDLDAVAVFRRAGPGWQTVAAAGGPLPATPDEAPFQAELTGGDILVLAGSRLTEQDARLLREFITELRLGQERRQLAHISRHPGRPHTNGADQPAPQP
jgi:two-component system sensor histidine kinase KdpD